MQTLSTTLTLALTLTLTPTPALLLPLPLPLPLTLTKVYLADDGTVTGEHACECVLPSAFGLTPATLTHGNRAQKA